MNADQDSFRFASSAPNGQQILSILGNFNSSPMIS
jgi:hypothetical protein